MSAMSGYVFSGLDWLTGKDYNDGEENDFWRDLPSCCSPDNEECDVFVPVDPETKIEYFLTHERVYYQAQLHLCLYYSLVRKESTIDFEKIYDNARKHDFWKKYVDNMQLEMTIGDYAILELCIDCVMLVFLMKHLPKRRVVHETSVDDSPVSMVFELIYFRLLRHICGLIEAYIDLCEIGARAMMTLKTARHLLCESFNRQSNIDGAGNQPKPYLGSPPPRKAPQVDTTHASENGPISTRARRIRPSLLKEKICPAEGDNSEVSSVSDIRTLHRERMQTWHTHVKSYQGQYAANAGLKKEFETLVMLLQPNRFPHGNVYHHVHKRAHSAMFLAADIVRKTCTLLYKSEEQLEEEDVDVDERSDQVSGDYVFNTWSDILKNVGTSFRHHAPRGSKSPPRKSDAHV